MVRFQAARLSCTGFWLPDQDLASLAQWTAHQTSNLGVAGSSPAGSCFAGPFFSRLCTFVQEFLYLEQLHRADPHLELTLYSPSPVLPVQVAGLASARHFESSTAAKMAVSTIPTSMRGPIGVSALKLSIDTYKRSGSLEAAQ